VDVGIILGVDVFQFRMQGFVAGAGQTGIAFRDLEERITFVEVGVVVISWQPAGGLVRNLVGLGSEQFVLNETPEWLGISEMLCT
jgi:hypothetical protein